MFHILYIRFLRNIILYTVLRFHKIIRLREMPQLKMLHTLWKSGLRYQTRLLSLHCYQSSFVFRRSRFDSHIESRLLRLMFTLFFSLSRQSLGQCLKTGHDHFHSHSLQILFTLKFSFIIHNLWSRKTSLNKAKINNKYFHKKTNSVALSPRAKYTDWATATCRWN
jgi:hypothetical protein